MDRLTVADAASKVGLSPSRIYGLVASGELIPIATEPVLLDELDVDFLALKHKPYHKTPNLMTVADAAEELSLSRQAVYDLIRVGRLEAIEFNPIRVKPSAVAKLQRPLITNSRLVELAAEMGVRRHSQTLLRWLAEKGIKPKIVGHSNDWPERALDVIANKVA